MALKYKFKSKDEVPAGTGTANHIVLAAGTSGSIRFRVTGAGTDTWLMQTTGHFLAGTDNTCDIGASGANRPRALYTAGKISVGAEIQFGGSTNSFPALKRNTTELQCRLADDSGFADFSAANIFFGGQLKCAAASGGTPVAANTDDGYIEIEIGGSVKLIPYRDAVT